MKEHEFTLVLTGAVDEDDADRLYGRFNDGTICVSDGVAQISFHRRAADLETAIRSAIGDVRDLGLQVTRVELEPDAVAQVI